MSESRAARRSRMNSDPDGGQKDIRRPGRSIRDNDDKYTEDEDADPDGDPDDGEDGDGDDEDPQAEKAVSRPRRQETRTTFAEMSKALATDIGAEFVAAIRPLQEENLALRAELEEMRLDMGEMKKALEDVADQGEENCARFDVIEKAMGDIPEQMKLTKALVEFNELQVNSRPAPKERAAPTVSNEELLVKGGAPNELPTPQAKSEIENLLNRGRYLLREHERMPVGLEEAHDAYTNGNLTQDHITALKKGLEAAEGELAISKAA